MRLTNLNPTETSLGASHQRDDFLGQEAGNSREVRWVRTLARVAFVLLVVGILAAMVVGPGEAIGWVVTYLIPTLVILGVVVGTIFLVAWEGGKAYDTRYPHK